MAFWKILKAVLAAVISQKTPPAPAAARPLPPERASRVAALDQCAFGLNSHLAPPDYIRRFGEQGIRWHRVDINWNEVERQQGEHDWVALDRLVEAAEESNLSLLGVIAYTPGWAVPPEHANEPEDVRRTYLPVDPNTYLSFVDAVLARYTGRFKALSVWNEPNLEQFFRGTPDDYIDRLLIPGLERIRQQAPEIVLAGPDLSSSGRPLSWLTPVLDRAGDLLDVISHHQYDGDDTPKGRAQQIDRLHELVQSRGLGDREIWITETGWKTERAHQASMLREMMAEAAPRSSWWKKTFWYDSHGEGWGLLVTDGEQGAGDPYPAFHTYAEVVVHRGDAV